MPKRKNRQHGPITSDERRARGERVVHREEMRTSIGDVLENEHVDEAIRLLYRRDELGGEATQPASTSPDHAANPPVEEPEAAKTAGRAASETPPPVESARVRRRHITAVSPAAVWRASIAAFGEISAGAQQARDDLMRAVHKAASAFRGEIRS